MSVLIRQILALLLGKVAVSIIKFVTGVLTARYLGVEGKGIYATYTRIVNLWIFSFLFSIGEGLVYYKGKENASNNDILGLALFYALTISVLACIVFFSIFKIALVYFPNFDFFRQFRYHFLIAMSSAIISFLLLKFLQAAQKFWLYNFYSILNLTLQFISIAVGLIVFRFSVIQIVYIYTICLMLGALIGIGLCLIRFGIPTFNLVKKCVSNFIYSVKVHALELPALLENQADIIILAAIGGWTQVGIYTVGVSVSQIMYYIVNAINTALFPSLSSTSFSDFERAEVTAKLCRFSVIINLFYILVMLLFGENFISLIFGVNFLDAYYVIAALAPAVFFEIVYRFLLTWHKSVARVGIIAPLGVISLMANLVLIPILYYKIGVVGVALSSTLTYFLRSMMLCISFNICTGISVWKLIVFQKDDMRLLRDSLSRMRSKF